MTFIKQLIFINIDLESIPCEEFCPVEAEIFHMEYFLNLIHLILSELLCITYNQGGFKNYKKFWPPWGFEPTIFCMQGRRATNYAMERPSLTRKQNISIITPINPTTQQNSNVCRTHHSSKMSSICIDLYQAALWNQVALPHRLVRFYPFLETDELYND